MVDGFRDGTIVCMSDDRVPPPYGAYEAWLRGEAKNTGQGGDPDPNQLAGNDPDPGQSVISDPDFVDPPIKHHSSKAVPARAIQSDDSYVDGSSTKPRRGVKKRTGLKVTLIVVTAVVLIIAGGLTYAWFDLNSRLNHEDVEPMVGTDRPSTFTPTTAPSVKYPGDPFAGSPVNILVMGTDSREGSNAGVSADDPGGVRSDTTFIAHVSADRTRVDAVSIPRDTYITIPQCTDENGNLIDAAGWSNMGFNAAFGFGYVQGGDSIAAGVACTIRAVEEMSNVRIDAYVVVDFMGFVDVVNDIGGLDVTLLCPIYSQEAGGLDLPEGEVHLTGFQAVNLARARTGDGLGGGSDLERIERQHLLFDAVVAKVYAMNYVTDFPKLYGLVANVIGSITTDIGKDLADIAGFAFSLKNFNTNNINFITVPVADADNHSNVVLRKAAAEPIWEALRTDTYLPGFEPAETAPGDVGGEGGEPETTETGSNPQDPQVPEVTQEAPPPVAQPAAPVVQRPSDC